MECKTCGKEFKTKFKLETHEKIHDVKAKKIKCPHCNKLFSKSSNLKLHCQNQHKSEDATVSVWSAEWVVPPESADEKSFKCEICQKSFTRAENLRYHLKTHEKTPKKVVKCAICDKYFSCLSSMRKHVKEKHTAISTMITIPETAFAPARDVPKLDSECGSSVNGSGRDKRQAAVTKEQLFDLSVWRSHRVLARQENIYVSGFLHSVPSLNTVLVESDNPAGTQWTYCDVLGVGRYDIICDSSPAFRDVSIGTRVVCPLQCNLQRNTSFIEAEVMDIFGHTKQFAVRAINSGVVRTMHRAQLQ